MKIKTLLAISGALVVGGALSVITVHAGKEGSAPATVKEKNCPPDCTKPDLTGEKTEGAGKSVGEGAEKSSPSEAPKEKEAMKQEKEKEAMKQDETAAGGATGVALKPEEEARKGTWRTDYQATLKLAQETKRPVLVDFSGSDWCGWCIKLDKEVFSQKAFQDYAKEHLVLFVADFPQRKKLPPEVQKQNEELARKHKIEGFPTVLLLSPKGEVLARTGYQPGGAEAYVKHVQGLLDKAKTSQKPSA